YPELGELGRDGAGRQEAQQDHWPGSGKYHQPGAGERGKDQEMEQLVETCGPGGRDRRHEARHDRRPAGEPKRLQHGPRPRDQRAEPALERMGAPRHVAARGALSFRTHAAGTLKVAPATAPSLRAVTRKCTGKTISTSDIAWPEGRSPRYNKDLAGLRDLP